MTGQQTGRTEADIAAVPATVAPRGRHDEARRRDAIFREVTGLAPRLWPSSILGYGRHDSTSDSGRVLATGFAPRKASLVPHIMPGHADVPVIPARLGPHRRGKGCLHIPRLDRRGKGCLHIPRLDRSDETALAEPIRAGRDDLAARRPVHPD